MEEEWKIILDYPDYMISNYGRVYSIRFDRFLKSSKTLTGYSHVNLRHNKIAKTLYIHRLLANAFGE